MVQDERKVGEDGPDQRGRPRRSPQADGASSGRAPGTYRLALRVVDGADATATVPASGSSAADGDWLVVRDLAVATGVRDCDGLRARVRIRTTRRRCKSPRRQSRRPPPTGSRLPALALTAVAMVALAVRLWGLGWQLPWQFHPDGGHYAWKAIDLMSQETFNPKYFRDPSQSRIRAPGRVPAARFPASEG